MDFSYLWWNKVPNAADFVVNVGEQILLGNKSIVLEMPSFLPWQSVFQDEVVSYVREGNSENAFVTMEAPADNVGEAIFCRFCNPEIALEYRPTQSYAKFLANNQDITLHHRYIWVKHIAPGSLREWMAFLSDYHANVPSGGQCAVFVLEVEPVAVAKTRGVAQLRYEDVISQFDAYTFCMMGISKLQVAPAIKPYLLELVYSVCQHDIELCALCMEQAQVLLEASVGDISAFLLGARDEVGSYGESAIQKSIWKAQVKILFPIIEDMRGALVERYYKAIERCLPIQGFGEDGCSNPEDVEIGTLYYMMGSGMVEIQPKDKTIIYKLRKARNELAHLTVLPLDELLYICSL